MNLGRFALRNDKVIVFAVVVLALLGIRSYLIAALPSVTNVLATQSQGSAELMVTFASATDPQVDSNIVNHRQIRVLAGEPRGF